MIKTRLSHARLLSIKFIFLLVLSTEVKSAAAHDAVGDQLQEAWSTNWRVVHFDGRLSDFNKSKLEQGVALTKAGEKAQVIINIYLSEIKKGFWDSFERDVIPRLSSRERSAGKKEAHPIFKIFNDFKASHISPDDDCACRKVYFPLHDPHELTLFIDWLKVYTKPNLSTIPRFRCKVEHNFDTKCTDTGLAAINKYLVSLFKGTDTRLLEDEGFDGAY